MSSPKRHVFLSLLFILKCFSKPFIIRNYLNKIRNIFKILRKWKPTINLDDTDDVKVDSTRSSRVFFKEARACITGYIGEIRFFLSSFRGHQ